MAQLTWFTRDQNGEYFDLFRLKLETVSQSGVYAIWHAGSNPRYVRVGQGIIANRLSQHRNDPEILRFKPLGLRVTWASVPAADRDGVERFLADKMNPLIGDAFPRDLPTVVNLPYTA